MLSRALRISRKEFGPLLSSRVFVHSPHFSLKIGRSKTGPARFAVAISKKVAKSAVVRNTLRRRVYGVFQELRPEAPATLFFFIAKPGSASLRGNALREEVGFLLKSAERSYNS